MTTSEQPPLVLVTVEDSDEDFDTMQEAVRRARISVEVFRATTGGDGLAVLRAQAKTRPTLVLMDLNTAGTDGREALAAIKVDPALKSIPVVVLSTSANPKDIDFCYAAGASAYHVKPVRHPDHLTVLVDLLTYWLRRVVLPTGERV